jgi:hypothetical protein
MGPRQWWIPEVFGHRPLMDDPPHHSCTMQGAQSSGTRQEQCCKRSPYRADTESRLQKFQERSSGIRDQDFKTQLHLGSEDIQQDLQEGSHTGDHEVKSWAFSQDLKNEWLDIVEGSVPSKTSLRAMDVRELITLRTSAQTNWKKNYGSRLGLTGTLSGSCSGWSTLRREQREQLESNHHENQATGKEGKTNHRHPKHSPWKRRNGGTSVSYLGQI